MTKCDGETRQPLAPRRPSSMAEHGFRKAEVLGSTPKVGFEETPIKTWFSALPPVTDTACLGHALGAFAQSVALVAPDLATVLSAWANLPDPVKAGIAAIAKATPPQTTPATPPQATPSQPVPPQATVPQATPSQGTSSQAATPQAKATSPQSTPSQATPPRGTSSESTSPKATSPKTRKRRHARQ